ncbi:SRPBCC family protein [Engelhardtia mirabilis]|uniref:Polyketide cyclase / dehydrase and lipid transport n=1 Tax=Engelhardtia mirabilis TaxID=2528011 RepID=A0A518BQB0_9BACT|nr:Polyketide cyclase / dehydrase and lipid transport [Planctomycetes bacterium Pla133]QDV03491.1 Polyketide cyclase / dehydrase and lipid transport [Planctomycetes bacterium Pla86]
MFWKLPFGLVLLVLLLVGGSYLLPDDYHVERTAVVPAAPVALSATTSDLHSWPEWTAWSTAADPEGAWEFEGAPRTVGHRMVWEGEVHGQGEPEFTSLTAVATARDGMAVDHGAYHSTGGFDLVAVEDGTEVAWSCGGESGMNPVGRWMTQFLDAMVGPDFVAGLEAPTAMWASAAGPAAGPAASTERG